MEEKDNAEIRSDKVRRLLGEIPPLPVRWGTVIIALIFAAVVSVVCLVPYPYSGGETILQHIIG